MKKTLALAIAPLFLAAACTSTGSGGGGLMAAPAAKVAAAGSQYCKKDRLDSAGDAWACNWSASTSDACETNNISTMKKSAIAAGPDNAGRCGNGQWLVSVTTK